MQEISFAQVSYAHFRWQNHRSLTPNSSTNYSPETVANQLLSLASPLLRTDSNLTTLIRKATTSRFCKLLIHSRSAHDSVYSVIKVRETEDR